MHLIDDGPDGARATLLLAPGASSNLEARPLVLAARALAAHGLRVVRCEFDYQHQRRVTGQRGRQPSAEQVVEEYAAAVAGLTGPTGPVVLGGLSFGGRVATMAAARAGALGAVALGYPFHPPSAPDKVRTAHLLTTEVPVLVCQGTRDEFGTPDDIAGYGLPDLVTVHWLDGADHGLRPLARSGRTAAEVLAEATEVAAGFVDRLVEGRA
ncbi:alpha/beta family hydrolase [Nocardioides sp.]|uniref:alpha/beta family hydrolase n=1 Tax=Nocardioides sp. TaxID=35761 RepID=UPI00271B5A11|nr:alpha/beta family hydrolase [Nocardioides sp.]MDO9456231.1 dienelactone hydrolase family protein [Nocardioides sp.]